MVVVHGHCSTKVLADVEVKECGDEKRAERLRTLINTLHKA